MKRLALLVLCTLAIRPALARAADLDAHLDLSVGSAYESNVFLAPSEERGSASATSRIDGAMAWNGETNALALTLGGMYQPYLDSDLGSANAIDLGATFTHDEQYGQSKVGVEYSNASSLVDAFDTDGEFVADERLEAITGTASQEVDLSETSALLADVNASTVTYHDTPQDVVRYDYDSVGGSLMWQKELSERLMVGFGAEGSWYEAANGGFRNEVTTIGPAVSARYAMTDRLSVAADMSYRRDETQTQFFKGFAVDDSGRDYFGSVAIRRELDKGEVALSLRRAEQPNSTDGTQDIRDEVGVSFRRSLTETLSARASTMLIDDNSDRKASDRKAVASELHLDWTLAERLVASFTYRYVWQRDDSQGGDAQAHAVALTFTRSFEHGR